MICFINRFKLLNTDKLGFLAGQNTSDAPTEFFDKTYDAIDQNRFFLTISLDFTKAFDTADHEILLKKYFTMALEKIV